MTDLLFRIQRPFTKSSIVFLLCEDDFVFINMFSPFSRYLYICVVAMKRKRWTQIGRIKDEYYFASGILHRLILLLLCLLLRVKRLFDSDLMKYSDLKIWMHFILPFQSLYWLLPMEILNNNKVTTKWRATTFLYHIEIQSINMFILSVN